MHSDYKQPTNPRLILASSSLYRQQLLARLQLPFTAIAPDIDERAFNAENAEQTALRLAFQKANVIAANNPDAIVIGSDQVATLNGMQIGKPGTHAAALQQLQMMRGQQVIFHTALCVIGPILTDTTSATDATGASNTATPAPLVQTQNVQTIVQFRDLPDEELDAYLHIEQPYDCAGSAKNEALGITIIEKISSDDPTALTGLPLIALTSMLRTLGLVFYKK
jgi:septum formation protein